MPRGSKTYTDPVAVKLAANVKRLREAGGFTVEQVAEAAGISAIMLRSVEACRRWPGPDTLSRIATSLGTTPAKLLS